MNAIAKLQFQRLPPEAKRAAMWRLAWSGKSVEQVRRTIDEESMPSSVSWPTARTVWIDSTRPHSYI